MRNSGNYAISAERDKKRFLAQPLEEIIAKWGLRADQQYIYVTFLQQDYRIDRASGDIFSVKTGEREDEVVIFDLLCHSTGVPRAAEAFAAVNNLRGTNKVTGVSTDLYHRYAEMFDADFTAFQKACEKLGARRIDMGDAGYAFTVFADLCLKLKFYHADEDFPASVTILFNENALEYLTYESTFWVMNSLYQKIAAQMSYVSRTDEPQ